LGVGGWYTSWGNGQEGGHFFFTVGGDLVYSSIVLAPLCGDVHKGRVYICGLFEEGWIPNPDPDPCKVCSLDLEMEKVCCLFLEMELMILLGIFPCA